MKDTYPQVFRDLRVCASRISCFNIQRYCVPFFLIALLVIGQQNTGLAADDSNQPSEKPKERFIRILSNESTEESLSKLEDMQPYLRDTLMVYFDVPPEQTPLAISVDEQDLITIIANRRFLKITEELSQLPKDEAADLVSKALSSSLNQYKDLFASYMNKAADVFAHNLGRSKGEKHKGLGFLHRRGDGKPTLKAVRYKVMALVLAAGILELRQAQPVVEEVLKTALEHRAMFYREDTFCKRDASLMLAEASLYNRRILATAVLGAYVDSKKSGQILSDVDCNLKSDRLTRYNADYVRYGVATIDEPDYTKGELTVKYLEPLNDLQFDNLVNTATNARQENLMRQDSE